VNADAFEKKYTVAHYVDLAGQAREDRRQRTRRRPPSGVTLDGAPCADRRRSDADRQPSEMLIDMPTDEQTTPEDRRGAAAHLRGSWATDDGRSAVEELLEERRAEGALEEAKVSGTEADVMAARENLARLGERHREGGTPGEQAR